MKKYQVFVSSTFTDLKTERIEVINCILKQNCIPVGMELFPSASVEQFDYIKQLIDDSDYYVLIIGARYGDMLNDISYTEQEFDYAVSKGVPVLAFLHEHPEEIKAKYYELDEVKRKKLENFKNKVKSGRLVNFWNSKDELASKVTISISQAIDITPRRGWERALPEGNEKIKKDNEHLKEEIIFTNNKLNELREEIDLLYRRNCNDFNAEITFSYLLDIDGYKTNSISLKKLFALWYPSIKDKPQIDGQAKRALEDAIANYIHTSSFYLKDKEYTHIKNAFSNLGVLAEFTVKKYGKLSKHIVVTDYGERMWNKFIEKCI